MIVLLVYWLGWTFTDVRWALRNLSSWQFRWWFVREQQRSYAVVWRRAFFDALLVIWQLALL